MLGMPQMRLRVPHFGQSWQIEPHFRRSQQECFSFREFPARLSPFRSIPASRVSLAGSFCNPFLASELAQHSSSRRCVIRVGAHAVLEIKVLVLQRNFPILHALLYVYAKSENTTSVLDLWVPILHAEGLAYAKSEKTTHVLVLYVPILHALGRAHAVSEIERRVRGPWFPILHAIPRAHAVSESAPISPSSLRSHMRSISSRSQQKPTMCRANDDQLEQKLICITAR